MEFLKQDKGHTVSCGDYGWVIDKSKAKKELLKDLKGGNPKKREPVDTVAPWQKPTGS